MDYQLDYEFLKNFLFPADIPTAGNGYASRRSRQPEPRLMWRNFWRCGMAVCKSAGRIR